MIVRQYCLDVDLYIHARAAPAWVSWVPVDRKVEAGGQLDSTFPIFWNARSMLHISYKVNKKAKDARSMVAQAPSGKRPLPEMMTSIRIDKTGQVEIIDQLLLP